MRRNLYPTFILKSDHSSPVATPNPIQTYSAEQAQQQLEAVFAKRLRCQHIPDVHGVHTHPREEILVPGLHTIGVLGGGQIGRYFLFAAKQRGFRTVCWSSQDKVPANGLCDVFIHAPYDDATALQQFINEVDGVTVEYESIPLELILELENANLRVRPGSKGLAVCQDRALERLFLVSQNIPVAPHWVLHHRHDISMADEALGDVPCLLKTTRFGRDGKSQLAVHGADAIKKGWDELKGSPQSPLILEHSIPFRREISIVIARSVEGNVRHYPLVENRHVEGMLNLSIMPAPDLKDITLLQAEDIARRIVKGLNYIGVLAVEFFELEDGSLLVNELVPRPHNSAYVTIEACHISQFDQQVSALTGMPLGNAEMHVPVAGSMNLFGIYWPKEERAVPDWYELLYRYPRLNLHLYGKPTLRPDRKMGHVTLTRKNHYMLEAAFEEIYELLQENTLTV
jgi:5-(carboxyamino)imidazole ribonucleotide synthase